VVLSPALEELAQDDRDIRIRFERFRAVGLIASNGLVAPDDLIAYIGVTPPKQQEIDPGSTVVRFGAPAASVLTGTSVGQHVVAAFALLILVPCAAMLAASTRLAAAVRDRRLRALRVLGVPPRPTAYIAAVESGVAAALGATLGLILFYPLAGGVERIPFVGVTVFRSDIGVSLWAALLVIGGITVLAIAVGVIAGMPRRGLPDSLRPVAARTKASRFSLLLVGIGFLTVLIARFGLPFMSSSTRLLGVWLGAAAIALGIPLGLPYALHLIGERFARFSRRAVDLLTLRRLAGDSGPVVRAGSAATAMLFGIGYAIPVLAALDVDTSWSQAEMRYGDRVVVRAAPLYGSIKLQNMNPPAGLRSLLPTVTLWNPVDQSAAAEAIIASCGEVTKLSASPVASCPKMPYVLATTRPGSRITPGDLPSLELRGKTGSVQIESPAETVRIDSHTQDLDGSIVLPRNFVASRLPAGINYSSYWAVLDPTRSALESFRASIAGTVPWAQVFSTFELPPEGEDQVRVVTGWIALGLAVGSVIGCAGLVIASLDTARWSRRQNASFAVLGAPSKTITFTQLLGVGLPLALAGGIAVIAGTLAGTTFAAIRGTGSPTVTSATLLLVFSFAGASLLAIATIPSSRPKRLLSDLRSE
jgi:hypothetical protein